MPIDLSDSTGLGYVLRIGLNGPFRADFALYEVVGRDTENRMLFARLDADNALDDPIVGEPTGDCAVFCRGDVGADGCMNFVFPAAEHTALHVCSRDQLVAIGSVLNKTYDRARELIGDKWYGDA